MNDLLREKLQKLPDQPGCYLMKDESGKIIYVGKAVNLKNRVRSYFRGMHNGKTELLVANIADFETVTVNSEAEALILEANLIRQHMPHYNILLRDDKHYPYLCLTVSEEYPRLMVMRRARSDGNRYFGPFPDVGAMHRAVEVLRGIFPLRTCRGFSANRRACLNAHIGRCCAPCEQRISREDYNIMVQGIADFLQGKTKDVIARERRLMEQAATELRFEEAAHYRDTISALIAVQQKQQIDLHPGAGSYDVLAVAADEDIAVVQAFFVRKGNVVNRQHFIMDNLGGCDQAELLRRCISDYYGGGSLLPGIICCNLLPEDAEPLSAVLAAQCGHKVEISVPQRGNKKRTMMIVEENARRILDDQLNSRHRREQQAAQALDELRSLLGLSAVPRRIECYDISHVQGTYMVGSMSVMINGVTANKQYRRFKIKTLSGSNDFAALQEVLERRWRHGLEELAAGKTDGFADFPDLLVIDGGKGQLHAVCDRLNEIGVTLPAIISLAKREEEVFVPDKKAPLILPRDSAALRLLQQIRDEAHRFAITFHRKLRGKGQTKSKLDGAPGIGPQRRASLLKCFGSLKQIMAADENELAAVPCMNRSAARALYYYLHPDPAGKTGEADE